MRKLNLTRRDFLRMAVLGAAGTIVAACGGAPATTPTAPPAATAAATAAAATAAPAADAPTAAAAAEAPTAAAAEAPTAAVAPTAEPQPIIPSTLKEVPRNQTVILGWTNKAPIGSTNPWVLGYTHQEGNAFMWEPLMYFGIYANKEIPWLADSMDYTKPDFTELTIKLNKDAKWSDGSPVTSQDVVFTFDGQLKNDKLPYHSQFKQFVKESKATDDQTVVVSFNLPAPRFKFETLMLKFDTGIPIVPAVLGQQADVNAYPGGTELIHSGPYDLISWDKSQKIYDLRENWWAVKAGRATMPAVKRVIVVNINGADGSVNMDTVAQRVVNNEFDSTLDMRSAVIGNILKQNPKVTSWTGTESPYGYLDWWPNSLWMNDQLEPYSNVRVRRAISLSVDRDTIDEVLYEGSKIATIYPFPLYPGLQKFVNSPAVKALEAKYNPREFNLEKAAQLMTEAGFTKNGDELWEKDGKTIDAIIDGFAGIHGDIVPVLIEMLKTGGFDANVNFGSDANQNMVDGKPGLYMFGHGASLKDPYAAFYLFHSNNSKPLGTTAGNGAWSRYKNPEYDAAVDAMAPLDSEDPKFQEHAAKALEIYWRDQIDVPIIQWLHRIPYNNTVWTNWPSSSNLAAGTNGAFWAHTGMLVITQLKPAG